MFRWPTEEILEGFKLRKPLKLKAIKTKGYPGGSMTAFQLIFEDGIESPMYDGGHSSAGDDISTIDVSDLQTKDIVCNGRSDGYIAKMTIRNESGSKTIYHKNRSDYQNSTRKIPDGYHIVGFYGTNDSWIKSFGLIVAKF